MTKHAFNSPASIKMPPGLVIDPSGTGIKFIPDQIPASKHFFFATDFMVVEDGSQIYMVFGSRSKFLKSNKFDRAIEIIFPKEFAFPFLVESVWETPSEKGLGKFIDSIELEAKKYASDLSPKQCEFELPSDTNSFRQFPANAAIASLASGQAMLEFLETSPGLLSALLNRGMSRPDDSVASLVNIIMEPIKLYQLFVKLKNIIKPIRKEG
jgi:hypothetical protein